jgi:hypothetical protein
MLYGYMQCEEALISGTLSRMVQVLNNLCVYFIFGLMTAL